ncbi:early nodulin-75-like [Kryptolebias marmoratus]|uniref:early nodulin-75-like n=1 Tax=Kryptolebias marmoratus TaxID=37003 RepID=UPI0007F8E7E1|nr:early nodulin-75-like [Kryptolebias marmoratus]
MTPALLLWISWMSLLLHSNHGFQAEKGGQFRPLSPALNLQDDGILSFDEGEGNSLENKPSGSVYPSFNMPSAALPPNFILAGQNIPNAIWQPSVQYPPVDPKPAGSPSSNVIMWSTETNEVEQPTIQFPPVNAKPPGSASFSTVWSYQGNEVGQPTSPVNAEPPSSAEFVPPSQYLPVYAKPPAPASLSTAMWLVQGNEAGQPTIQYPPENTKPPGSQELPFQGNEIGRPSQYTPVYAKPPATASLSTATWSAQGNEAGQPSQYTPVYAKPPATASLSTATWYAQGNEVGQPTVQYPPVNQNFPSSEEFVQGSEIASSSSYASPPKKPLPQGPVKGQPSWMDFVFSNLFGDEDFNDVDFEPQNSAKETETIWVPMMAEEPPAPPPHPRNFIVHSKNGYKRGRVVHTKTFYSTDYDTPKMSGPFTGPDQKVKKDAKVCPRCS